MLLLLQLSGLTTKFKHLLTKEDPEIGIIGTGTLAEVEYDFGK